MERKYIVMFVLVVLLVSAVLDFVWNDVAVFEKFGSTFEVHRLTGGLEIDERTPSAKGDQEFNLSAAGVEKLRMVNSLGNMRIEGTDEEEIRVQVEMTVYANELELAQEVLQELQVEEVIREGVLLFQLNQEETLLPAGIRKVWIDYTMYLPKNMEVDVMNHGDMVVRNLHGKTKLNNMLGTTLIVGLGNGLTLVQRSGDTQIQDVTGDLDLRAGFGNLTVENVQGDLKMRGTQTKAKLTNIQGNVECDNTSGELEVVDVAGKFSADLRHSPLDGENLAGPIDVESSFGDVDLVNVGDDVQVYSQQGDISIRTKYDHRVDVETIGGRIYVSGDQIKVAEDVGRRESYQGQGALGEGTYRMNLKTRFGDVHLK